jgi:chromosomal replication initiation ATPase DnaA
LGRSFSDAERIVDLIDRMALQQKRKISVELASQALRQLEAEQGQPSADNPDGLG